jgi:hypothetical protein
MECCVLFEVRTEFVDDMQKNFGLKGLNKFPALLWDQKFCCCVNKYPPPLPVPSRRVGVADSVLVTGPKGCGFDPGQGDGVLRAIKIRSTPSFRM